MWTDESIQRLRQRITEELKTASGRHDWDRVQALAAAGRLIDQRKPGMRLDALVAEVKSKIGAALVREVLEGWSPPEGQGVAEPTSTPKADRSGEKQPSQRPPKEEALPDTGPQEPGKTSGDSPSQPQAPSGQVTPEQVPSLSPAPALSPEQKTELERLLTDLRRLRDTEPGDLAQLPTYISQMRRLTQRIISVAGRSREAIEASGEIALLQEMHELIEAMTQLKRDLSGARNRLDLDQARRLKQEASILLNRAQDRRFRDSFYDLASRLETEAIELAEQAEDARREIAGSLLRYLTRQQEDERERLESRLDDLAELSRTGATQVPVDFGEQAALKPIDEVIRDYTDQLLVICRGEGARLLREAKEYLKDDELTTAEERYETGLNFIQSRHVKSLPDVVALAGEYQDLKREIERKQQLRDQAQKFYEQAVGAKEPVSALEALLRAEEAFPKLAGLREEKARWLQILWGELEKTVSDTLKSVDDQILERKYQDAIKALDTAEEKLDLRALLRYRARVEDAFREAGFDVAGLRRKITDRLAEVKAEHSAWLAFQPRLESLRRDGPRFTSDGKLDEKWFEGELQRFSPEDVRRFGRELEQLKFDFVSRARDDARYDQALALFQSDPANPRVGALLREIGRADAKLYENAQLLIRRHRAYVALNLARIKVADRPLPVDTFADDAVADEATRRKLGARLAEDPEGWLEAIERLTQAAQAGAREPDDLPLIRESQNLVEAARRLRNLQRELSDLLRQDEAFDPQVAGRRVRDIWEEVEARLAEAEKEPLLGSGALSIRAALRKKMRNDRLPFVKQRVQDSNGRECRKQTGANRTDLQRAAHYVEVLERRNALTEDGDAFLAACVRRLWHEAEVEAILGRNLADADDAAVVALSGRSDVDWEGLLTHLEELTYHTRGTGGASDRAKTEALRTIALGYAALNQPLAAAIERLKREREETLRLRYDPVVCGMLALRQLEDPAGRPEVQGLVSELREQGRPTRRLAEAIEMLLEGHVLSDSDEPDKMELAIATVTNGKDILKELAPGFADGFDQAIQDTIHRWQQALGKTLLDQAWQKMDVVAGLEVFPLLHNVRRGQELRPGDPRSAMMLQRLTKKAEQAFDELHGEVERLLNDPPTPLDKAIRRGKELISYLHEAVGPDLATAETIRQPAPSKGSARRPAPSGHLATLAQDLENLESKVKEWERAKQSVDAVRRDLGTLLSADWRWNTDPKQTPNRELRSMRERLNNFTESSSEVKAMLELVRSLEKTVNDISQPFEDFRSRFEGEDYRSDRDFDDAKAKLRELQQKMEEAERNLGQLASRLNWTGPTINLRRFFWVRDTRGRPRPHEGHWVEGASEELRSLAATLERLEEWHRNWKDWQEWVRSAQQLIAGGHEGDDKNLFGSLADAKKYKGDDHGLLGSLSDVKKCLNWDKDWNKEPTPGKQGRLGKAIELYRETIPMKLQDLERHRQNVPAPPLHQLAIKDARQCGELPDELANEREILTAWQRIREDAVRAEIPAAWSDYLRLIGEWAQKELTQLHDLVVKKNARLRELIRDMNQHVRLYRRPTGRSQEMYAVLLDEAEFIDAEDVEVKNHRRTYESNQSSLRNR